MRRGLSIVCVAMLLTAAGVAGAMPRASGLAGRIVAGPTCPVERIPPDPQCAPRPLVATLRIGRTGRRRAVIVRSAADGGFRVRLPPGNYVVEALASATSPFPRPPAPIPVRVMAHRFTHLTITYDTGIR